MTAGDLSHSRHGDDATHIQKQTGTLTDASEVELGEQQLTKLEFN